MVRSAAPGLVRDMSEVVIQSEGLGKSYFIGHQGPREKYNTLRDVISRQVGGVWNATKRAWRGQSIVAGDEVEEFWALRDVSFEIKQGEVVGIIGRNGAGKSTLLKILSRITEPTAGRVTLRGRVASLLEVGTGFHPELTGRENIFLNGAILGMTRSEIKRKFDEIVAFAEVEKFLDTPVKRYSSGMYVRLAFAVAAHLEPEILVVDEVLAVGDAEFQKKCLGKMQDVAKGGRTVLFVSHNMAAVQKLCTTSLYLDFGKLELLSDTDTVVSRYLAHGLKRLNASWSGAWNKSDGCLHIGVAYTCAEDGLPISVFRADQSVRVTISAMTEHETTREVLFVRLFDHLGQVILTSWDSDGRRRGPIPKIAGECEYSCEIPGSLLKPGVYEVTFGCFSSTGRGIRSVDKALQFEVTSAGYALNLDRQGIVSPVLGWTAQNLVQHSNGTAKV